jgi:hypothetical protein
MLQVSMSGLGYRGVHDLPQGRLPALVAVELLCLVAEGAKGTMGMSLLVFGVSQRCFVQGIASTGMK